MEIPERHFDWDHIYPDVSPVSSNPSYAAFRLRQPLDKNPGVYTLPNFDTEDKDEFFIYGTCVSVRGEQSESRPEYADDPVNDVPVHGNCTFTAVEESYESKINELQRQIKKLEAEVSQVPVLQDNLRYLYEENMLLHQKEEIKESHRIQMAAILTVQMRK
ncbi:unnamed protein product [Heterobilharzia americana]|nr:unnamed protein product [Heterobilharzia americana]